VEAACKTLATQRLKGAGMRWRHSGGQAILTWRALGHSDRFVRGWNRVAQTYKRLSDRSPFLKMSLSSLPELSRSSDPQYESYTQPY
jgi:hypothetical protein